MRTTARTPKVTRARGHSTVPVGRPVDATTSETFEAGVAAREEKARSLAEERDLSWLSEGALAYMKYDMESGPVEPRKDPIGSLVRSHYSKKFDAGTPVIFSEARRKNVILRRGPARIVQHVWVTPDGNKYVVALTDLRKDQNADETI